ncbi:hypothetical protein [Streptomyces sp. N35]|uniref:hypothetical protein n=1 Tax=Streptomyces sp. N35 TaxID=2795730 RepID=UPI0018F31B3C|nr:hypothetical protein [Streptomyces sp. N35]
MRMWVTVFRCDWPDCGAQLVAPTVVRREAQGFARARGWLRTADDAEQHFCGGGRPRARGGHAELVLDSHLPALIRLPAPWHGWSVNCWCGWSGSKTLTVSFADSPAEARERWAGHLPAAGSAAA